MFVEPKKISKGNSFSFEISKLKSMKIIIKKNYFD